MLLTDLFATMKIRRNKNRRKKRPSGSKKKSNP